MSEIICPCCGASIAVSLKKADTKPVADDVATPEWLQEVWNLHKHKDQVGCDKLNATRKRAALQRIREIPKKADWLLIIKAIAASPFHRGEQASGSGRKFHAGFDYLVRAETPQKALEHARAKLNGTASTPTTARDAQTQTRNANVAHAATEDVYRRA